MTNHRATHRAPRVHNITRAQPTLRTPITIRSSHRAGTTGSVSPATRSSLPDCGGAGSPHPAQQLRATVSAFGSAHRQGIHGRATTAHNKRCTHTARATRGVPLAAAIPPTTVYGKRQPLAYHPHWPKHPRNLRARPSHVRVCNLCANTKRASTACPSLPDTPLGSAARQRAAHSIMPDNGT